MNILFRFLARQILRRLSDPANVDAAVKLLLGLGQHFIEPSLNRKYAAEWQRNCFHVTHMNFYSPIPNINELPDRLWESPSKMISIDMNDSVQLQLMQVEFPRFRDEYMAIPAAATAVADEFHLNNPMFDNADALALYCMIRTFAPRRFIEIGSGYSTRLAAAAAKRRFQGFPVPLFPLLGGVGFHAEGVKVVFQFLGQNFVDLPLALQP